MPYITKERREKLEDQVFVDEGETPGNCGELNYLITKLISKYAYLRLPMNYQAINDIVGALDGAKAEFQRRVVVPYENLKREENGDVYNDISPYPGDVL